jgi:hypothetical protein
MGLIPRLLRRLHNWILSDPDKTACPERPMWPRRIAAEPTGAAGIVFVDGWQPYGLGLAGSGHPDLGRDRKDQ